MKSRLRCITLLLGILFSEKLALAQEGCETISPGRFFEALRGLEIRRQVTNRYTDSSFKDFKPGPAQAA
jgi:hypothetical protein